MNGLRPSKKYVVSPPISMSDIRTRHIDTMISELNLGNQSPRSKILETIKPIETDYKANKEEERQISSKLESKIQELKSGLDRLSNLQSGIEQKLDNQMSKVRVDLKREYNKKIGPDVIEKPLESEIISAKHDLKEHYENFNENKGSECVKRITDLIDNYNKLTKRIIKEREAREKKYENIIESLGSDILRLNNALANIKSRREELHLSLIETLNTHKDKIVEELQTEKVEREKNETMLVKLLECIINRYENSCPY